MILRANELTKTNPLFFQNVFDCLYNFNCENVIQGGDFNLVLDTQKDKLGGLSRTHQSSLKVILEQPKSLELVDIWRYPESGRKTFSLEDKKGQGYIVDSCIRQRRTLSDFDQIG